MAGVEWRVAGGKWQVVHFGDDLPLATCYLQSLISELCMNLQGVLTTVVFSFNIDYIEFNKICLDNIGLVTSRR